jgi:hypothetical protein
VPVRPGWGTWWPDFGPHSMLFEGSGAPLRALVIRLVGSGGHENPIITTVSKSEMLDMGPKTGSYVI